MRTCGVTTAHCVGDGSMHPHQRMSVVQTNHSSIWQIATPQILLCTRALPRPAIRQTQTKPITQSVNDNRAE